MTDVETPQPEQRILVYAPIGKDGRLIAESLERFAVKALPCRNMAELLGEVEVGAAAIFLMEEVLDEPANVHAICSMMSRQPTWSDLPLIVCYGKHSQADKTFSQILAVLERVAYVTLLERPTNPRLLVNAARSAIRSRVRQYERRKAEEEKERLLVELALAKEFAEGASKELLQALGRETESRQTAEEANRSKDVFLATLSHELRTPLNAILGFSELLPFETPGTAEFASALATIARNAKAQKDLIDDILDVSRIISGKLVLQKARTEVIQLLKDAQHSFQIIARQKDVSLEVVTDVVTAEVLGDGNRLQQVIWNLISNAIKFTPSGGRIRIHARTLGDNLEISVTDSGEGIAADFLPFIFDRFRQQDGSFARRFGGLGLGLSIVRYLVEAHGGTIEAVSAGKDQGSSFKVMLPLLAAERPARIAMLSSLAKAQTQADPRHNRVLVVDDQDDSRRLVSVVLQRAGFRVVEADSASQARAALADGEFDAMVCDIGMPNEDGLTFIRQLRATASQAAPALPAAALSGFVSEEDKQRAIKAGFDLHLSKPALPREVVSAVTKLVNLRSIPNETPISN